MKETSGRERIEQTLKNFEDLITSNSQIFYIKFEIPNGANVNGIIDFVLKIFEIYTRKNVKEYVLSAKTIFRGKEYLAFIIPIKWFKNISEDDSWKTIALKISQKIKEILGVNNIKIFNGLYSKLKRSGSFGKFMKILFKRVLYYAHRFRRFFLYVFSKRNLYTAFEKEKEKDKRNPISIMMEIHDHIERNIERKQE